MSRFESNRDAGRPSGTARRWGGLCVALALAAGFAFGQEKVDRILKQDPSLDNLADPAGYRTAPLGTIGAFTKRGTGPRAMILIPGLGFGGDSLEDLMAPLEERFTMYAVTLPGMGGTPAPPSPAEGASFGGQSWTNGALKGIEALIEAERIRSPVVVGHWMTGTQLALRLALEHPDQVAAVVIVSGTTRFTPTDTSRMPAHPELDKRIAGIDQLMGPRWFKTVTRETWDDNNFMPWDYAVHPVLGLRLWREAARPPLHVWVRYLCEFFAQDVSLDLGDLKVPALVLRPGLEGLYHDPGSDYMNAYAHAGWDGAALENPHVKMMTIPKSRIFMWLDQPEAVRRALDGFLDTLPGR